MPTALDIYTFLCINYSASTINYSKNFIGRMVFRSGCVLLIGGDDGISRQQITPLHATPHLTSFLLLLAL